MPGAYPGEGQTPREAGRRCRLSIKDHASDRRLQRGIRHEEIRDLIVRGTLERVREVSGKGVRYRWESSNRMFRIAYYVRPCVILVKTVMYR